MVTRQVVCMIFASTALFWSSAPSAAQQLKCTEVHAMAGIASAKSTTELMAWNAKAGDSNRAKIVFSFRLFELHPTDPNYASAILDLIPKDENQSLVFYSLSEDIDCQPEPDNGAESEADMRALARLESRLPRDWASAVLLVPSRMSAYVAYANASSGYPDSDYAVQMQRVCRTKRREFRDAVDHLSPDAKRWFLSSTFNPDGCHALHFPEQ